MTSPGYAEIGITTNFSFLRGGSDPRDYVHEAGKLHLPIIGIADHNTLAGVVRAYKELDHPDVEYRAYVVARYAETATWRRPTGGTYKLFLGQKLRQYQCLRVPLSDDGATINMIIAAFILGLPSSAS